VCIQGIAEIGDDPLADVFDQIRMAEIEEASQEKRPDDQQGEEA